MSKSEVFLKEIIRVNEAKNDLTERLIKEEMLMEEDVLAYTSINSLASALGFSESYLNGVIIDSYYSDKY